MSKVCTEATLPKEILLGLSVAVHPAKVQDRDGAALVLDERTPPSGRSF
jgi:hypothetical protein